jgi:hypothetical protein
MSKKILRQNRGILIFGERNSTDFVGLAARPVDRRRPAGRLAAARLGRPAGFANCVDPTSNLLLG